jgi:exodeoxyribonuclease III
MWRVRELTRCAIRCRTVRIVTWNVNSIRARQPRLEALLARWGPDIVCLQETKIEDAAFPADALAASGYAVATHGERTYNGVAILARSGLEGVACGFSGDPVPGEARVLSATVGGLHVVNVYAVNGKSVGDPAYVVKLAWFDAFDAWIRSAFDPGQPLMVVGDFNVAPEDEDVHDPPLWRGRNLASEPERERIRTLRRWGLVDLTREQMPGPGPFTWWDYRAGAFHRGWGLRLDLALATPPIAARRSNVVVDREERKPSTGEGNPSDHAPVIIDLD